MLLVLTSASTTTTSHAHTIDIPPPIAAIDQRAQRHNAVRPAGERRGGHRDLDYLNGRSYLNDAATSPIANVDSADMAAVYFGWANDFAAVSDSSCHCVHLSVNGVPPTLSCNCNSGTVS